MIDYYERNLNTPVFISYPDGTKIQNGCLADYPGKPVPKLADNIIRFNMLPRRGMTIHQAIREISKLTFSKEQQRLFRVYCSEHYGLPLREEDRWPIN